MIFEKINYQEYRWMVNGDFKMLTMLLGQQAGYTKYRCFLCLWDSWSPQGALTPYEKNVINTTLVPPEKVSLSSLPVKFGLMKQFIQSLPKDGECFRYLCSKFPKLSEAKLKERVFTGRNIRKLLSDSLFSETMGDKEKEASDSFKDEAHRVWRMLKTSSTKPLYNAC
ncbi:hypothetical protein AVEN_74169-1 [Araneus ventricosus]|uniref:Uncharacterized protein n=1 Tax=Araneus ventricosus TaxID=182803 RepID=A0A4Y2FQN4_ARAVE|nr:hypothetical protein AVEN_74169-1 [Araneus ventricosus]